ncbi:hypothetical protein [Streptosporangium amethystogenes]|uniref:hypothetical protein n=1 Tax=Streptosporangium amethystogenes TaxID=2002 RepID=UPI0012F7AEBA|nr:hypothetical protein [Streptosporangium amethystogenes]
MSGVRRDLDAVTGRIILDRDHLLSGSHRGFGTVLDTAFDTAARGGGTGKITLDWTA